MELKFWGEYRGVFPGSRGWFHHDVVVKDGRVYDAFGPDRGLPIKDYKKLFENAVDIDFGF